MANTIQLKRSSTAGAVPSAGSLSLGELAVNSADGKLFTKRTDDTVVEIGGGGGEGGISTGTIIRTVNSLPYSEGYLPCNGMAYSSSLYPELAAISPKYYPSNISFAAMPSISNHQDVVYGNGLYVAISYGSANVFTSPDGLTWTQRSMPASRNWVSIAFGIVYSNDGGVWGNYPRFVAVAYGTNIAAYSADGITWTETTLPYTANWTRVKWTFGAFELLQSGSNYYASSSNGQQWSGGAFPLAGTWSSIANTNTKAVALASSLGHAAFRTNLTGWTNYVLPVLANWSNIATDGSKFVTVSNGNRYCMVSEDGLNWTLGYMPRSIAYQTLIYADGEFLVTGNTNYFYSSKDGLNWQENTFAQSRNTKVSMWNGTSYIILGYGTSNTIARAVATPNADFVRTPWFDSEQRTPLIKV